MASVSNVKGALLEELILHLLKGSGYVTIDGKGTDKTLEERNGMLWVKGRGEQHQIDAVADYKFSPPFSNPQRLLVEGKCEARPIGLPIVRNSVGVHKDVSEFFIPDPLTDRLLRQRYHYQCAIFSSSGFSKQAQNFAYAQDVILLDLGAGLFRRIVGALNGITKDDVEPELSIPNLRRLFRRFLRREVHETAMPYSESVGAAITNSAALANQIGFVGIGMINGIFPIFLVPESADVHRLLLNQTEIPCRIRIENREFRFETDNQVLFRFSIPEELFKKCFDKGEFDQGAALNMKQQYLNRTEVSVFSNSNLHKCILSLDPNWLNQIRDNI